jgi:CheY-like chemotaxis protein
MSNCHTVCPSRHILVIEDNDDGRESLRLLLSLLGHRVEVAADGEEGVRKALQTPPEVAIVDINMPRLNGYQVARQLRAALGQSIRLIAHTAYSQDSADQRVADAAFDAWLVKPVEFPELMFQVEERGKPG